MRLLFAFFFFVVFLNHAQTHPVPISFYNSVSSNKSDSPVKKITLDKQSQLAMRFDLKQPLIEHLRALKSEWNQEALLGHGNFKFKLYVNGDLIYTEPLNLGAGTLATKTSKLEYHIPLVNPESMDFWGWYLWLRFMKLGGGVDAFQEGSNQLRVDVHTYLNAEEIHEGPVLATGTVEVVVPPLNINPEQIEIQPIAKGSGFKISSDTYDRERIEALHKKILSGRFEHITGIVVLKDGELLIESYFNGFERERLHDTRSVTKTMASAMMGIAIKEGHIANENQVLSNFYDIENFDNYSRAKSNITLKSLLTMSSGFQGDDMDFESIGHEELMYPTDNWVKFTLDLPMDTTKISGKDFQYFTAGVVILGDIIHKSVPNGLVDYTHKKLMQPLGITNYKWEFTPQDVGNTAGGLRMRALDLAKFGQLYQNKGLWESEIILEPQWVEKSFKTPCSTF